MINCQATTPPCRRRTRLARPGGPGRVGAERALFVLAGLSAAALLLMAMPAGASAHTNNPAPATHVENAWDRLRFDDLRLAAIVHRLALANVGLCDARESATGLILQSLEQYPPSLRDQARAAFDFNTPLAVEAVVPGGPAEQAGIRANDSIVTIAGQTFEPVTAQAKPATTTRDRALAVIRQTPAGQPIAIGLLRAGQRMDVQMQPVTACAMTAEVVLEGGQIAESDDNTIQVGIDLVGPWPDNDIAVLVAHEMAHIVLKHGDRISDAHVHHGMLGQFGKSLSIVRAAEDEADRFSIRLLANAGYDPRIGPEFWRHGKGRSIDAGIFRSPNHGSPRERASMMEDEITRLGQPFTP